MPNIRVLITRAGPNKGKVLTMDLEAYLIGVVSSEMSDKWPMQALMAQAVAARTYAMAHLRPGAAYDVDDTTKYQAYKPRAAGACPNVERAIWLTAGMVLRYGGKLISAVYSSSNGGQTRSAKQRWGSDIAYLPSKPDPWDKASGTWLRGHGVGMSQRGAQYAANHGVSWRDILAFYYPGCSLEDGQQPDTPPQPKPDPKPQAETPDTISLGDHGELVMKLQRMLNSNGAKLKVDGIFGKKTLAAVRAYQMKKKLLVDGVVGPKTWGALLA